jgi:hypothetical protein
LVPEFAHARDCVLDATAAVYAAKGGNASAREESHEG